MVIHCVRTKQIRKGHYMLMADGIIEVQGYCYPVEAGTIVAPSEETVMITDPRGNQYIWKFITHKSEWELNLIKKRVVLKQFDGSTARVLLTEEENIGRCHKAVVAMRYNNLLYDLPRQICMYINTAA